MCPIMGEYTKPEADTDIAAHAALTTGVHGVGTGIVGSKPINRLAGVLATTTGWNTAPSSLANATDGDFDVGTGVGVMTSLGAWGLTPAIYWDMGATYNIVFRAKLIVGKVSVADGGPYCWLKGSTDNSNWYNCNEDFGVFGTFRRNTASGDLIGYVIAFFRARYISLQLQNDANVGDVHLGIYEAQAIDFGV